MNYAKALKNKAVNALTKGIRHFPDKHHKSNMKRADKDYAFTKSYNDRRGSGQPISNKDESIMDIYRNRNK